MIFFTKTPLFILFKKYKFLFYFIYEIIDYISKYRKVTQSFKSTLTLQLLFLIPINFFT